MNDNTESVIVLGLYNNNILSEPPSFYKEFNNQHNVELVLFVSGNDIYKADKKSNKWYKNSYTDDEYNFIQKMKFLNIKYPILFKIDDLYLTGYHNYSTILRLLADLQELQICSIHGIESIDFGTFYNTVIATFDAEAG